MSSVWTQGLTWPAEAPALATTREPLEALLQELYREQLAQLPDDRYLQEHARAACIANQVRTFHWYRPYLPAEGAVLDWGCNHAPDSCLLRAYCDDRFRLHGCDFVEADRYAIFHQFARCSYTRLADPVRLPYEANRFEAVIGSGVLEHAALDLESLKELYRVLKPGGVLVVSYLPNWLSVHEWVRRVVWRRDFHRRLYGRGEAKLLLKRCGFYPLTVRYHTFVRERLLAALGVRRWERGLSELLARLVPVQVFSSTLCLVAEKVTMM
jgi:SAM-dependent methyltransferase